jgi:hypothetical protein
VSNQDHHRGNWELIIDLEKTVSLAPTFDNASGLARNERDEERVRRMTTRDKGSSVETYVQRARSAFYLRPTSEKPLSTLEAFQEAAKIAPEAASYWLNRMGALTVADLENMVAAVPASEISEPARQFALKIMEVNRQRLLALA